jgi:hypothetical protein
MAKPVEGEGVRWGGGKERAALTARDEWRWAIILMFIYEDTYPKCI